MKPSSIAATIAVVNDLLTAPDSHPRLAVQLAAIQRRLRDYAKAAIREEATDPAVGLLRDIAGLHCEMASLATQSASGSIRSAAARTGLGHVAGFWNAGNHVGSVGAHALDGAAASEPASTQVFGRNAQIGVIRGRLGE